MSLNIELKRCSNLTVRGLDDVFVFSLVLSDINRQLLEQTTLDASHIRVMSCCVVVVNIVFAVTGQEKTAGLQQTQRLLLRVRRVLGQHCSLPASAEMISRVSF